MSESQQRVPCPQSSCPSKSHVVGSKSYFKCVKAPSAPHSDAPNIPIGPYEGRRRFTKQDVGRAALKGAKSTARYSVRKAVRSAVIATRTNREVNSSRFTRSMNSTITNAISRLFRSRR